MVTERPRESRGPQAPGKDLLRAEAIRVRRGRAVNPKNMRRKQVRKLGYSFQLVVRLDGRRPRSETCVLRVGRKERRETTRLRDPGVANTSMSSLDVYEVVGRLGGRHPAGHLRRLLAHLRGQSVAAAAATPSLCVYLTVPVYVPHPTLRRRPLSSWP